jgi:hypothetical protein
LRCRGRRARFREPEHGRNAKTRFRRAVLPPCRDATIRGGSLCSP